MDFNKSYTAIRALDGYIKTRKASHLPVSYGYLRREINKFDLSALERSYALHRLSDLHNINLV